MITRLKIRGPVIVDLFVVASLPAALFGIYNAGRGLVGNPNGGGVIVAFLAGAAGFLPSLLVAVGVSLLWGLVFAIAGQRRLDPAWLMSAWLFVLLLPPGVPLIGIAAGLSFGLIFGMHVFGGTGKYLVSPALLGALFLQLAYPAWFDAMQWLPQGDDWGAAFVGFEHATAWGTSSELLCLIGAAMLMFSGAASWRVMAGAVFGAALVATLGQSETPWFAHLITGQFVFCVAFIATDPSAASVTRAGRWAYGALIGVLTLLFRIADPAHPEGTLFACLAAALFAPLIDAVVVRIQAFNYRRVAP